MVELKDTRMVAVIGWDTELVQGSDASIQVQHDDGELEEVRNVKNDGETNLFFPFGFDGEVTVTVRGSHSGEDVGTFTVSED